jgi:hypothetical protein
MEAHQCPQPNAARRGKEREFERIVAAIRPVLTLA